MFFLAIKSSKGIGWTISDDFHLYDKLAKPSDTAVHTDKELAWLATEDWLVQRWTSLGGALPREWEWSFPSLPKVIINSGSALSVKNIDKVATECHESGRKSLECKKMIEGRPENIPFLTPC